MAVQGEFHQVASDTKSPCGLNQGHKYPPADGGIQNSQRDTGNQLLTTRIRFWLQKKLPKCPLNTKAIFKFANLTKVSENKTNCKEMSESTHCLKKSVKEPPEKCPKTRRTVQNCPRVHTVFKNL